MKFVTDTKIITLFSLLDWLILGLSLLVTVLMVTIGQRLRRRGQSDLLDYLVMGRQLTLPLFVCSLVATWYGGVQGVTQISFESGVYNFVTQGLFWYGAYLVFAFWIAPKVRARQAITLPELVGSMFGPRARRISAVFNFFDVIPISYTMSMGLLLQSLFGGNLAVMMALGVLFVLAYSVFGGFRADVFSELIQFALMCVAVGIVVWFSASAFGGLDYLRAHLPQSHFEPLGGHSLSETFVWGLIAFSTLVDPTFYQKVFAARDLKVARTGILISTGVWFLFDMCTTLGGMYARAAMPTSDGKNAYLLYSVQLLPEGLRGFFFSGLLAPDFACLAASLLIAGTTVSYDLAPKAWADRAWVRRMGVMVVGILAIGIASIFEGNIAAVWKTLGSYSAACLLLPVLVGYAFPGKITDRQFVWGSLFGAVITTIWRWLPRAGYWAGVDEIYAGVVGTLVGMALSRGIRYLFDA